MFKRIPILMYHSIEPEGSKRISEDEKFYNVTPEKFGEQMKYLKKNGFSAVTCNQLLRIEQDAELPRKPIMLTFDDGYISHYDTVMPILKECGFAGVFFLVCGDIGKKYRLNVRQARELKDFGMDIGSHGLTHSAINKFSIQKLIFELKASKIELEDCLGKEIAAFSIPRGFYSHDISDVARGMGYKLVFTSFTGNATLDSNPYRLRRIVIRSDYAMKEFISIVRKSPGFIIKRRVEQFAKNRIHDLVGPKRYERIKKAVAGRKGEEEVGLATVGSALPRARS